jgi:signal transduction histidine kinase
MPSNLYRRTKVIMALAFAVIALCLFVFAFVEYAQTAKTRSAIADIQQNALVSVELVHRIGDDIHGERLLLDRHVFEHDLAKMHQIENSIEQFRKDYEEAARAYESLPAPPDEVAAWRELTSDVTAARLRVAPVLEVSRQNRVDESVQALEQLDPLYEKIAADEARLDRINQTESNLAVADVRHVQMTSLELRLALLAIVLATVVLIGTSSTRSALKAQQELASVNQALAERNRDLDAFAGRLAHDLRGPLGTIGLSTNIVAQRFPDARPTTAIMERSIKQIANLIDELLTLSRLGAVPDAAARAESVAAALGQRLEPLVSDAGGTLCIDLQAGLIACSESLLSQVLWNLGENAVKYRRPEVAPSISIEGRVSADRYIIRVSDNGMGMTETDARRAFEPFYRGEHGKIAGTGLGLAIVRRIVEASHGTIAVESQLDEGTTFIVSLPLASSRTAASASRRSARAGAAPMPAA